MSSALLKLRSRGIEPDSSALASVSRPLLGSGGRAFEGGAAHVDGLPDELDVPS